MKIEIDIDESDVMRQILQSEKESFIKSMTCGVPIYSFDKDEEKKMVKKMLKAYNLLMDYYGANLD